MQNVPELLFSTDELSAAELRKREHSQRLSLNEVLGFLASPDTGKPLCRLKRADDLTDGENIYPARGSAQILLPAKLHEYFATRLYIAENLNLTDSFLQYFQLSSIKQSGEINAPSDDTHYQRHLYRIHDLLKGAEGMILDVGCDDPSIGASLCPSASKYIGLDPFCYGIDDFRLVGVGEYLPFKDGSLDGVLFNTSLDHILDWRRAISEAGRVLKSGGKIYLSTLVWSDRADLIYDAVHFHHFREYEIFGGLADFSLSHIKRYSYKDDEHRHGLYLVAEKK